MMMEDSLHNSNPDIRIVVVVRATDEYEYIQEIEAVVGSLVEDMEVSALFCITNSQWNILINDQFTCLTAVHTSFIPVFEVHDQ